MSEIFTIGHSNHDFAAFVGLLKAQAISMLVDARTYPHSKYANQFDRERLAPALTGYHITYLYLGNQLGGRPAGVEYYDSGGHVLYDHVAASGFFAGGIRQLETLVQDQRVAVMCSEEDPAACHRHLLIGRVLFNRGIVVYHIRGDGSVQSEQDLTVEASGSGGDGPQLALFEVPEERTWKSTQSVLRKRRRPNSSAS